jgi:hypothetical protein
VAQASFLAVSLLGVTQKEVVCRFKGVNDVFQRGFSRLWRWFWRWYGEGYWLHDFKASQSGASFPEYVVNAPMPANKAAVVHGIQLLHQLIPKLRQAFLGSLKLFVRTLLRQLLKDRVPH